MSCLFDRVTHRARQSSSLLQSECHSPLSMLGPQQWRQAQEEGLLQMWSLPDFDLAPVSPFRPSVA